MHPGQQRDPHTTLGRIEAWSRSWFEWNMSFLGIRLVLAAIAVLVAIALPLWIVFVSDPARERQEIADAQQCFDERKDEILAFIADVPDADKATALQERFDVLAKGPQEGRTTYYCADVIQLDADAEWAGLAPGEYPDDFPWPGLIASPDTTSSPLASPSVSVSPTP